MAVAYADFPGILHRQRHDLRNPGHERPAPVGEPGRDGVHITHRTFRMLRINFVTDSVDDDKCPDKIPLLPFAIAN